MFGKENIKIRLVLDEFEFEFFEGSLKEMFKVIKQWRKLKPDLRNYADSRISQNYGYYPQPVSFPAPPMPPVPPMQPQPQPSFYQPPQQFYRQNQDAIQQPNEKKQKKVPDEIPPLDIPQQPIIPPRGKTIIKVK
jgi:hypothetical protein